MVSDQGDGKKNKQTTRASSGATKRSILPVRAMRARTHIYPVPYIRLTCYTLQLLPLLLLLVVADDGGGGGGCGGYGRGGACCAVVV